MPCLSSLRLLGPSRWSAATRLTTIGVFIIVGTVGLTALVVLEEVQSAMIARAQAGLDTNLKLATRLLRQLGGDSTLHVDGEHLVTTNGRILDESTELVDDVRNIAGGTATIFRGDLRVSTNVQKPDGSRAIGTRLAPGPVYDTVLGKGLTYRGDADILGVPYFTVYQPLKDAGGATIGILYVGLKQADFFTVLTNLKRFVALAGGLMVLVGGGSLFVAVRLTFRPLDALRRAMGELARGKYDIEIPARERADEVGRMALAVQVFKDNALRTQVLEREQAEARARLAAEAVRMKIEAERAAAALVVDSIGAGLERLAAGDLTYRLEQPLPGVYEKLRVDLNTTTLHLHDLIGDLVENTFGIRTGTAEIARTADELSKRTEQQAASLEETAAALEEITVTVQKTAAGTKLAHDVVSKTRTEAAQSGVVMMQAVTAMGGIERSAGEISQIISLIDEVALQTNLLALNAGIEAARAGDAGKGFAVVASEIRSLAGRSAAAAKEIKRLVTASAEEIRMGARLVGETGEALDRIMSQVAEINQVVSDISRAAAEQAIGLAEVNTAVSHMDQVTQHNAAMFEASTLASHHLAQDADELSRLTSRFCILERAA